MNIDSKKIIAKIQSYLSFLKRYVVFIYVVAVLFMFSFFVFRINQISRLEPTDQDVEAKLQNVQRPKIDQTVIDKIEQLKSQNIEVQSLFDQARNNPFNE